MIELTLDQWHLAIANEIDAMPDEQDFCDPYTLGQMDSADNIYLPPRWDSPSYDAYHRGWNDEWARLNGRTLLR